MVIGAHYVEDFGIFLEIGVDEADRLLSLWLGLDSSTDTVRTMVTVGL